MRSRSAAPSAPAFMNETGRIGEDGPVRVNRSLIGRDGTHVRCYSISNAIRSATDMRELHLEHLCSRIWLKVSSVPFDQRGI